MFELVIVHYSPLLTYSETTTSILLWHLDWYPMSILTRKRRRSEAFHDEAEEQQEEHQDAADGSDNGDGATSVAEVSEERAKKEREVWDAFREEQYESVSFRIARMLNQDNPDR